MAGYLPAYTTGTASSTMTWQQWVTGGTVQTTNAYTYVSNSTTASTTWDRWVDVGYITVDPPVWQHEIWGEWIEDDAERERRQAELQRQRDELQARREQRSREELAARQAREEQMAAARGRARELLELVVHEEDWVPGLELIQVRGSDGELYRIELHRTTVHGNIVRVDEHGCILGRACVAPAMYTGTHVLPTEDGWVGQYLGLKFDAEEFLSHANWSGRQPCRHERRALPVAA